MHGLSDTELKLPLSYSLPSPYGEDAVKPEQPAPSRALKLGKVNSKVFFHVRVVCKPERAKEQPIIASERDLSFASLVEKIALPYQGRPVSLRGASSSTLRECERCASVVRSKARPSCYL